jgi:hypothetical protein
MSPEETNSLRKDVKKKMVDLDMDSRKRGSMSILSENLSRKMGRRISRTTLSMALSGFRDTSGYQVILKELNDMLAVSIHTQSRGDMN